MKMMENNLFYILDIMQYTYESEIEYLDYALTQALKLTESKFGYIYHYDEEKKSLL